MVNGILICLSGLASVPEPEPRRCAPTRQIPQICRLSSRIVFLNELLKQPGVGWREDYSVAYPDMTTSPLFPGFDGLMTLSRREGVDIRPTLLRVLTDLYVQASVHSEEETRQFVELPPA